MSASKRNSHGALFTQLCWFIRLRWIAGLAVLCGALVDLYWMHWFADPRLIAGVGIGILAYNLVLRVGLDRIERSSARRRLELLVAWAQLLLELTCLTLLSLWTGGLMSPVATFFVFHMVFASLLLPRRMAYAGAVAALLMFGLGLWLSHQAPTTRSQWLLLSGRATTLILTVYLTNHLTFALRRQRGRLIRQNRRIRQITHQLRRHQQAMVQHEKMVAMGQMAAGVAHEIANPLASMDCLLQLMQRKPEKLRPDAIATLREQIARISQIIYQMKAFAHPVELSKQTQALNEVVAQAVEMVRFDKRLKRVVIDLQLSAEVGEILMIPQALQQVIINLIVNALDAVSDACEPRLIVRTERRPEQCLIEVSDNGQGIKPEHMDRLFEPFFTTKPVGKGTGLGLSISYILVQKQGGQITVRSQVGRGTTFTIRLPAGKTVSRERETRSQAAIATENPTV